ncbi:MAG: 50S ribosomal protein L1 [Deltaproteobacteria bacterium]|nr:50S ribosomal protein L1 [Deltaproteobacteria bacterium]
MAKRSKKFKENQNKVDKNKRYSYKSAVELLLSMQKSKFDESVDVAFRLGIDPKQSDQQVRSSVVLPHGTGKSVKVLVLAKGDKEQEAKEAGADFVGFSEYVEKIQQGWLGFEKVITTPDLMGEVSKLGKILGPKGLMPNPKMGTVTFDIANAVKNEKRGKVEFRNEKTGNLHVVIGKASFGVDKLSENFRVLFQEIIRQKPQSAKGNYIRTAALSLTQSPGIRMDVNSLLNIHSEGE